MRATIRNGRVLVTVEDEAGKVDLNSASEPLLRALLAGAGATPVEVDRITAAILDYRDADNLRRPDGAEADEYRLAGRQNGPKNAPFDSIFELGQVLGVDAALAHQSATVRDRPFWSAGDRSVKGVA